jgi:type II secretory pathway component PulF
MTGLFLGVVLCVVIVVAAGLLAGVRATGGEPTYRCVALSPNTYQQVHRTVIARSEDEATGILKTQGYLVQRAWRVYPWRRLLDRGVSLSDFRRSIPQKELSDMAKMLAISLDANMTIQDSIAMFVAQKPENKARQTLRRVLVDIRSAQLSVEDAFAVRAEAFGPEVVAMIRTGAKSKVGLAGTFEHIAELAEKRGAFAQNLKKSLIYPAILGLLMLGLMAYLITKVMPQFVTFYKQYNAKLPGMTTITISAFNLVFKHFFLVVLLVGLVYWLRQNPKTRLYWDRISLKIPIVGKTLRDASIGRTMATVAAMVPVGIPIQRALQDAIPVAKNRFIEQTLRNVLQGLRTTSLQQAVKDQSKDLPAKLVAYVQTGAATGSLDEVLSRYARITQRDLDVAAEAADTIIGTVLFIIIAVPLVWVFIAMWLPMVYYLKLVLHPTAGGGVG